MKYKIFKINTNGENFRNIIYKFLPWRSLIKWYEFDFSRYHKVAEVEINDHRIGMLETSDVIEVCGKRYYCNGSFFVDTENGRKLQIIEL